MQGIRNPSPAPRCRPRPCCPDSRKPPPSRKTDPRRGEDRPTGVEFFLWKIFSFKPFRDNELSLSNGWIGVDLDGTLAQYDHWRGEEHIGDPVPRMLERVKEWLAAGIEVRIFTARISESESARPWINAWCEKHLGVVLTVTCKKDYGMVELWDDRAVQVVPNTGERVDGL